MNYHLPKLAQGVLWSLMLIASSAQAQPELKDVNPVKADEASALTVEGRPGGPGGGGPGGGGGGGGPGPSRPSPSPSPSPRPSPMPSPMPRPEPRPSPSPMPRPEPRPSPSPIPSPMPRPTPAPMPRPEPRPSPSPIPSPMPRPEPFPSPRPTPGPTPQPNPIPRPNPVPQPSPVPHPQPVPQPNPGPHPGPAPQPNPIPRPSPVPQPSPVPHPQPNPAPRPTPAPQPNPGPVTRPSPVTQAPPVPHHSPNAPKAPPIVNRPAPLAPHNPIVAQPPVARPNPIVNRPMPVPNQSYHNGSIFPGPRIGGDSQRWGNFDNERRDRDSNWGCYPFYPFTYDPYPYYPHPWHYEGEPIYLYPGYPAPGYGIYPVYPVDPTPIPAPVGPAWQRVEVDIDQQYTDASIALTELMGLQEYTGYSIESVEVYGDYGQWSPRTLQLTYDNNDIVDTETTQGGVVVLRPVVRDRLMNENLYNVGLNISGSMFIERIVVNLRAEPTLASEEIVINQPVFIDASVGAVDVDVFAQTQIAKYKGYRLIAVGVDGLASANASLNAQLFVNTYNMGAVYMPNYSVSQQFYVNPGNSVVGNGLDNMHIFLNGSGQITNLHLRLLPY